MIQYRKATKDDIPALVQLRIAFLQEVMMLDDTPDIAGSLAGYFIKHLEAGDYVNWIAVDRDLVVSTGGIYFYSLPPNFHNATGDRAYILNVYTLPDYRRKGISLQLFGKLMQEGEDRGIVQISLHATEEGKSLYEKFGFRRKLNEMVWGNHI